jgi:hypothetical protein
VPAAAYAKKCTALYDFSYRPPRQNPTDDIDALHDDPRTRCLGMLDGRKPR